MATSSTYTDRILAFKKRYYHVDAVRFGVFETASSMLKKLKPYTDAIEVVLNDERGVLKPSTILLAEDLIKQYKEWVARLHSTRFGLWISRFGSEQRKAIEVFAGNLSRGHDSLVREATDKTSPEVVAKITAEAAEVGFAGRGTADLEVKSVDGQGSFWVIFDISEKIYIGGFGNTFRVKRKDDPLTLYALKVSAKGAEGLQDLEREKLIWQDLKHENILPLLGTTGMMSGKSLGLLSPYIESGNLARLRRENNYTEAELISMLRQTCDAIRYLHHKGIIHGDIKPENILVSPDGTAFLCDFGLSKSSDFVDTAPNHIGAGSGSFVAPELREAYSKGLRYVKTKESDIFALGKTMAQVISGEPSNNPLPPIPETLCSESEKAVWALAERCCLPESSRPDIHHVAEVLREIENGVCNQRTIPSRGEQDALLE